MPSSPHRQHAAPRRAVGRLIGALSLLTVAILPGGPLPVSLLPADFSFGPSITVTPAETTLGQFTQLTASGADFPLGTVTIRLQGVVVGTVQAASPDPKATTGGFGPTDFAVPANTAACGSDLVTADGFTNVQAKITVYCPQLVITPSPVFSGGTATDLELTASGLGADRTITLAIDDQSLPSAQSDHSGQLTTVTIADEALACGTHQLTVTIQPAPPPPPPKIRIRSVAAPATYPLPTATATITVLGCASSDPAPAIFTDPIETGIDQFTQFDVVGFNLAAGPATIKLGGVTAGTVTVGTDGSFPQTVLTVPAGAATCGPDTVTIDDVAPAVAASTIDVFCPSVTVTPNPVFSGGAAADLSIAGTGYPGDRDVDFTVDGQDVGTVTSNTDGSVGLAVPGIALACGDHQVVATAVPRHDSALAFAVRDAASAADTVPIDPPIPAAADVTVLGCASSTTPPQLHAIPIETTLHQFTRFTVDGSLLPAGPATIRLRGAVAGKVQVGRDGTFPATDLRVPTGAAACGQDTVTIDNGGPVLATTSIAVYCPSITVIPNPVDSGGRAAVLNLTGVGFPPNRTVNLGFDGKTHATVSSDAKGAIHGTIRGIAPACGQHQATATAQPPAAAVKLPQAFLPVSAAAQVVVVGCARITADPAVIQQGTLTHVTGTGFLPRTAVTLTWQSPNGTVVTACSPTTLAAPALTTDAAGRIDVFCLAFLHQVLGTLRLSALQSPEQETTPVVVEDGSMQPSNGDQFVFRR
jgi:hypothetical protein